MNDSSANRTNLHTTLARSYMAYFLFSLLGLLADSIAGFQVVVPYGTWIALVCFGAGPLLMLWAQTTSAHYRNRNQTPQNAYFLHGPYRFLRNPTHLGIVIMVTGYAAVSGSVLFLAVTLVGYIVSNMLFKRYESILTEQYGSEYSEYKSGTPKIL